MVNLLKAPYSLDFERLRDEIFMILTKAIHVPRLLSLVYRQD